MRRIREHSEQLGHGERAKHHERIGDGPSRAFLERGELRDEQRDGRFVLQPRECPCGGGLHRGRVFEAIVHRRDERGNGRGSAGKAEELRRMRSLTPSSRLGERLREALHEAQLVKQTCACRARGTVVGAQHFFDCPLDDDGIELRAQRSCHLVTVTKRRRGCYSLERLLSGPSVERLSRENVGRGEHGQDDQGGRHPRREEGRAHGLWRSSSIFCTRAAGSIGLLRNSSAPDCIAQKRSAASVLAVRMMTGTSGCRRLIARHAW